jgi:hypothetical protein
MRNAMKRVVSFCLIVTMLAVIAVPLAQARFLTPDTYDPWLQGVDANRYAYAGDDPVNGSDPNGHQSVDTAHHPDQKERDSYLRKQAEKLDRRAAEMEKDGFTQDAQRLRDEAQSYRDKIGLTNSQLNKDAATSAAVDVILGTIFRGDARPAATVYDAVKTAANRTLHELYKDELRAAMQKPAVRDKALAAILDRVYRPNATVGSGSTAAAVRSEISTGQPVGEKFHTQKSTDVVKELNKWMNNNPTASPGDRAAAENVLRDMLNALGGR